MQNGHPKPEHLRAEQLKTGPQIDTESHEMNALDPAEQTSRAADTAPDSLSGSDIDENSAARTELSSERLAQIRMRILSGAYDSLAVVDQVARRMLARGDIP